MTADGGSTDRNGKLLIAHVLHRLDYGGLENGLVNLVNRLDPEGFSHVIISLSESTGFAQRITNPDVHLIDIGKAPGKDIGAYRRLFRHLRSVKPDILHTRNIGTIDCVPVGRLAGIRRCIHGEHGWDTHDIDGLNPKYRLLRRICNPMIERFVTVSRELEHWLESAIGISGAKILRICNGVDTDRFHPREQRGDSSANGNADNAVLIGSVCRFNDVKDPLNLVRAFCIAAPRARDQGISLRLQMIGDGPLRANAEQYLQEHGLDQDASLPGSRDDVADVLREFDVFVLASRREGISNTILEAMASGLPVIATATGGNNELVLPEVNGDLVPCQQPDALADAILELALDPHLRKRSGLASRKRALAEYSLENMVDQYRSLYRNMTDPVSI